MKVIERRDLPDARVGRFQCLKCTSIFETEPEDIAKMRHHAGSDQYNEPEYWSIDCPVCDRDADLMFPLKEGETRFDRRR